MSEIDKRTLTERDICTKFINPALESSGWDLMHQIREQHYFTDGRIMVRGKTVKRGERKFADYLLFYKSNIRLAVIEAKDNTHGVGDGMQQGLEYARILDVPFVFSTNGDGFLMHDRLATSGTIEEEIPLDRFPSPEELFQRMCKAKNLPTEKIPVIAQDYFSDGSDRKPRYYQLTAIDRTIEAIALGQKRVLLVMATGTGKTFTAFQIIWRLWKSGAANRILFLADRNILVDQSKTNDFKPFGSAMTKIQNRHVDKAYEIYLCLYQAVTGTDDDSNIYKQFSPDFFDLIVIDECHRGSAAEDSSWREILSYFSSATHVGMTATPKETKEVSNITYFGEPVYTYTLKQGIEDGFLAPYKVVRIDIDKDMEGWRPTTGKSDKHGEVIEDRIYNQKDFDRTLVLEKRTELVAKKVTEFLKGTNRFDKTIVFCEDIDHAERMRQALVNENADLVAQNHKYVMRITGDNNEGKKELEQFINPSEPYPVIVTTSELMTTGVDAQTCKLIVLDKSIQSSTKFKQIIGRGTRINEEYGKLFFTIMDFKKATEEFADPKFNDVPDVIYIPKPGESPIPPDGPEDDDVPPEGDDFDFDDDDNDETIEETPAGETKNGNGDTIIDPPPPRRKKYYVNDVPVRVTSERVQYYGNDGKLITESLTDYTRKAVLGEFTTLDVFLQRWSEADRKQTIVSELENQGVFFEEIAEQVGKGFDPFDLVCHVAFDQPPLTRRERADKVKKRNYFAKYGEQARAVLEALLDKYADEGIGTIETLNVLKVQPFDKFGMPVEIVRMFGGKDEYDKALRELETALYSLAQ